MTLTSRKRWNILKRAQYPIGSGGTTSTRNMHVDHGTPIQRTDIEQLLTCDNFLVVWMRMRMRADGRAVTLAEYEFGKCQKNRPTRFVARKRESKLKKKKKRIGVADSIF